MNRLPVLERTYDFLKWLVPAITQFPRQQRFLLGERIDLCAFDPRDFERVRPRVGQGSRQEARA